MKGKRNEVKRQRLKPSWSESHQSSAGETLYVDTLGCQLVREIDGAVLVNVYGTLIALYGADSHSSSRDRFDPFRVGLDHLALAVEDASILEDLQRDLDAVGVGNHGVEEDMETHDKYISFFDPDGIAWELYSVSTRPDA